MRETRALAACPKTASEKGTVPFCSEPIFAGQRLAQNWDSPRWFSDRLVAMLYYTLNTGDIREVAALRSDRRGDRALQPLLNAGWHTIPEPAEYECQTTIDGGLIGNVSHSASKRECVLFGVAKTDEQAAQTWKAIERSYLSLRHERPFRGADFALPSRPPTAPGVRNDDDPGDGGRKGLDGQIRMRHGLGVDRAALATSARAETLEGCGA